jgi:MerR family transcriptional regulator, copper efflux regulator
MTTKTLRFYEDRGLLPAPFRAGNGYRDYSADVVPRLDFIRRGRATGLSLSQIGDILKVRDAGTAPCTHVRELLNQQLAEIDQKIAELTALRASVAEVRDATETADPAMCTAEDICSYI